MSISRPRINQFSHLDYCQYLLSSQTNYTLTNYAEHVAQLSHDMINRYLQEVKLTPQLVWEQTSVLIKSNVDGFIIFDDSVIDKNYSRDIESVRTQYSGNVHRIIRGIGMVNCIYVNPTNKEFWVIDYRIFYPERDGKTKMAHVKDMLTNLHYHKKLVSKTVLMDRWYASNELILFIADLGKLFYCPVKSNRLARALTIILDETRVIAIIAFLIISVFWLFSQNFL